MNLGGVLVGTGGLVATWSSSSLELAAPRSFLPRLGAFTISGGSGTFPVLRSMSSLRENVREVMDLYQP